MKNSDAAGSRAGSRFGRQAEAERNDLLVLYAARAVFAEQGADAPASATATRAGVGIGTLSRPSGNKEPLLPRPCFLRIPRAIAEL
ncbi:hypothetical protein ACFCXG_38400, partial [Streptomyces sp. NPDC056295]